LADQRLDLLNALLRQPDIGGLFCEPARHGWPPIF
jgi:hypothetical protein